MSTEQEWVFLPYSHSRFVLVMFNYSESGSEPVGHQAQVAE